MQFGVQETSTGCLIWLTFPRPLHLGTLQTT